MVVAIKNRMRRRGVSIDSRYEPYTKGDKLMRKKQPNVEKEKRTEQEELFISFIFVY